MHLISWRKLRLFIKDHPAAGPPLASWRRVVNRARWASFAELRRDYASADRVGRLVVFDIGGNEYRLIASIHFNRGKVFVRHILTHQEYDRGAWKDG